MLGFGIPTRLRLRLENAKSFPQFSNADGRIGDVPIEDGQISSDIGVLEVNDAYVARFATK
jgi:hypothetical protein